MDNIFTPEEANMPVTYEALLQVLQMMQPAIESRDEALRDHELAIERVLDALELAEYKRIRDMRFTLSYLAAIRLCDNEKFYKMYEDWCKEYDKLNKPNATPEGSNG